MTEQGLMAFEALQSRYTADEQQLTMQILGILNSSRPNLNRLHFLFKQLNIVAQSRELANNFMETYGSETTKREGKGKKTPAMGN